MEAPLDGLDFDPVENPVPLMDLIQSRDWEEPWVSDALDGLRAALRITAEQGSDPRVFAGQPDRLPLARALRRALSIADVSLAEGLEILISEWLIGQHVYWAVGRSGDDTQRLRLMLDEGGWTALVLNPSFPDPTPDRLASALSLMADVGLAAHAGEGLYQAAP